MGSIIFTTFFIFFDFVNSFYKCSAFIFSILISLEFLALFYYIFGQCYFFTINLPLSPPLIIQGDINRYKKIYIIKKSENNFALKQYILLCPYIKSIIIIYKV